MMRDDDRVPTRFFFFFLRRRDYLSFEVVPTGTPTTRATSFSDIFMPLAASPFRSPFLVTSVLDQADRDSPIHTRYIIICLPYVEV